MYKYCLPRITSLLSFLGEGGEGGGGGKRRIKNKWAIDIFYICTSFFIFFFITPGLYINLDVTVVI